MVSAAFGMIVNISWGEAVARLAPAGQSAHHRGLPGHVHTAARFRQPARRQAAIEPQIAGLDAPMIGAFLDHLEHDRGNGARPRNARRAAIHSLVPLRRAAPP
jgi:hypothetical protein